MSQSRKGKNERIELSEGLTRRNNIHIAKPAQRPEPPKADKPIEKTKNIKE